MHWSLRMILDMPKAILLFRKTHIMMGKIQKVEKKEGSIAGYKAMLEYPTLAEAEVEIYIDLLPEVMEKTDNYSAKEIEWFLNKGEELGVITRIETTPEPNDDWRRWEEE